MKHYEVVHKSVRLDADCMRFSPAEVVKRYAVPFRWLARCCCFFANLGYAQAGVFLGSTMFVWAEWRVRLQVVKGVTT